MCTRKPGGRRLKFARHILLPACTGMTKIGTHSGAKNENMVILISSTISTFQEFKFNQITWDADSFKKWESNMIIAFLSTYGDELQN